MLPSIRATAAAPCATSNSIVESFPWVKGEEGRQKWLWREWRGRGLKVQVDLSRRNVKRRFPAVVSLVHVRTSLDQKANRVCAKRSLVF